MGKNTKVRDSESPDASLPPTLVKVGTSNASAAPGTGASTSSQPAKQNDMLAVLTGISGILQTGFDSLNKKVAKVSDNIGSMEDTMLQRFDNLVEHSEPEVGPGSDDEDIPVLEPAGGAKKRKRQDDHDLSDGEEQIQSAVLTEASNALDEDDTIGPAVKDHVTAFVKKAFEKPLKGDNVKKFKDKFPVPSNIDCLGVPRVNEPIYLKLSATAKNEDKAIQNNQAVFMKVVTALVRVTDVLAEHENEGEWVSDIMKMSTDAITLSASLKRDWLKARRDDIKPSLPEDFKRLASVDVVLSANDLFGDDLEGSIKSVENTNKIANKMDSTKKQNNQNKPAYKENYKKKKRFYNNNNNNKNNSNHNKKKNKDKKDFQKRGSKN